MCTVSFVSSGDTSFITSNRDEHISRPPSFQPKEEIINGCRLIYPKDPKAGGTWFAINNHGEVAVLLNGAFEKHISLGGYAKSRGLILLDIISAEEPAAFVKDIDLENIEPFTLILFKKGNLLEFRWDGSSKHIKQLDITKNYIWSSATLYTVDVVKQREALFVKFLENHKLYTSEQIVDFHNNNGDDYENGFVINRKTGMKTFSVTQAIINLDDIVLNHSNLLEETQYSTLVSKEDRISAI